MCTRIKVTCIIVNLTTSPARSFQGDLSISQCNRCCRNIALRSNICILITHKPQSPECPVSEQNHDELWVSILLFSFVFFMFFVCVFVCLFFCLVFFACPENRPDVIQFYENISLVRRPSFGVGRYSAIKCSNTCLLKLKLIG